MFWTNLWRKTGYFHNPFRDLFAEEFEKAGGPPAIPGKLLKEDGGDLLLEDDGHILLE